MNRHVVTTMREVVVATESMTAEQIVFAKRKFDGELTKKYYTEAVKCTKQDLLRGTSYKKRKMRVNQNWCAAWERYSYLREFIRHLDEQEQTIEVCKFPIRTISEYIYVDGVLSAIGVELMGMEAKCVLWADGKRSIEEIARQEGINLHNIMRIYATLNERGFLYFSEF